MRPSGGTGNRYYGTTDGEFMRQRFEFCICSFCFRQFAFNERVIFFKDRSNHYYVCLDHETPMRERQVEMYEKKLIDEREWDAKKKILLSELKIKKRSKDDERVLE